MASITRRNPSLLGDVGTLLLLGGTAWLFVSVTKGSGPADLQGAVSTALGNLGNAVNRATGAQISAQQLTGDQLNEYLVASSQGYTPPIVNSTGQADPGAVVPGTMQMVNGQWTWAEWGPGGQLVTKTASGSGMNAWW